MRAFLGIELKIPDIKFENQSENLKKAHSHHITLFFWHDLSEKKSEDVIEKLSSFKNQKFKLVADRIERFPNKRNPHIIALLLKDTTKLNELHMKVLQHLNLSEEREFKPHITLFRIKKLDESFKDSKELIKKIEPIDFEISNITLYSSDLSKGTNAYTVLKKIELD